MTIITPNPKPRSDLGWASFAALLEVQVKHMDPGAKREVDGHFGEGRTVKFFTGVKCPQGTLSVRAISPGVWKFTIVRPAGRGGIAPGTKQVERVYMVASPDDVYAYVDQFDPRNPVGLEVASR